MYICNTENESNLIDCKVAVAKAYRFDEVLIREFDYVTEKGNRSVTGGISQLMQDAVDKYKKENGIPLKKKLPQSERSKKRSTSGK